MRHSLRSLWFLLPLSLALFSCSSFMMKFIDDIIINRIEQYVPLTDDQEDQLRGVIQREHGWFKAKGFDLIIATLREVKVRARDGITREDLQWADKAIRGHTEVLVGRLINDAATLLANMTPAQLSKVREKARESWKKERKKFKLTPAARYKKRLKGTIKIYDNWFGGLSSSQEGKLDGLLRKIPSLGELRYRHNRARLEALMKAIETRQGPEKIKTLLESWLNQKDEDLSPEFREARDAEKEGWLTLIVEMDRLLSEEQRKDFMEAIDEKIELLEGLKEQ